MYFLPLPPDCNREKHKKASLVSSPDLPALLPTGWSRSQIISTGHPMLQLRSESWSFKAHILSLWPLWGGAWAQGRFVNRPKERVEGSVPEMGCMDLANAGEQASQHCGHTPAWTAHLHFLLGSHTSDDSLAQSKSKSPAVPSRVGGRGECHSLLNLSVLWRKVRTILPLLAFCDLVPALLSKPCLAFVHSLHPQWPCPCPQVVRLPHQVPPERCTCLLFKFFHPLNFSYTSFLALGTHVPL